MATSVTWNGSVRSIPASNELNWSTLSDFLVDLGNNAQTTNFQRFAIRVATTTPVTVLAASDCVVVSDLGVAGPVAFDLPAGSTGQVFILGDGKGDASTNNITITPNGAETINGAASYVIAKDYATVVLGFVSGDWKVLSEFADQQIVDLTSEVSGTLPIGNGGTGQTTANAALNAFLPAQGASANQFLQTDGSNTSWAFPDINTETTGTLAIGNGGTGQTTANAAFNALAPTQTAQTGQFLQTDGTNTDWVVPDLSTDITGTLAIGNGGTGQTTANAALNALLPSQAGQAGNVLSTDGSNTSWASALTDTLTADHVFIGNGSNVATAVDTTAAVSDTANHIEADSTNGLTIKDAGIRSGAKFSSGADATASQSGVVNTGAQSFAGAKTFQGDVKVGGTGTPDVEMDIAGFSAHLRSIQAVADPLTPLSGVVNFSSGSGTINGITAPPNSAAVTLVIGNGSGNNVTFAHESGTATAVNRIVFNDAVNHVVANNEVITFVYIGNRWFCTNIGT